MQKIFIAICALIMLEASINANPKSKTVADAKKEVALKQSHPDLAFMGKVLMLISGIGFTYFRMLQLPHRHPNEDCLKRCQKFKGKLFQFSWATGIAGAFGYCIGKKYYKTEDSSLKNLFSRAALAQKIFNV